MTIVTSDYHFPAVAKCGSGNLKSSLNQSFSNCEVPPVVGEAQLERQYSQKGSYAAKAFLGLHQYLV